MPRHSKDTHLEIINKYQKNFNILALATEYGVSERHIQKILYKIGGILIPRKRQNYDEVVRLAKEGYSAKKIEEILQIPGRTVRADLLKYRGKVRRPRITPEQIREVERLYFKSCLTLDQIQEQVNVCRTTLGDLITKNGWPDQYMLKVGPYRRYNGERWQTIEKAGELFRRGFNCFEIGRILLVSGYTVYTWRDKFDFAKKVAKDDTDWVESL